MPKRTAPVEEVPVTVWVDGAARTRLRATPDALPELAAGHLLVLRLIADGADLAALDASSADAVRVTLAGSAPSWDPAHPAILEHVLACPSCTIPVSDAPAPPPGPEAFGRLLADLYAGSRRYADTGGVHAAALSDGERLLFAFEDVGRHNAVDKALGGAVLAGTPLQGLGLVVSARISGEIAFKAARAGLAWVASRSLPTTLAVTVARAAGLVLVARAGSQPRTFP